MSSDVHQWLLRGWLVCIFLNAMCQTFLLVTKEYNPDTYILYLHLTAFNNRRSCMEVDRAWTVPCENAVTLHTFRSWRGLPSHFRAIEVS